MWAGERCKHVSLLAGAVAALLTPLALASCSSDGSAEPAGAPSTSTPSTITPTPTPEPESLDPLDWQTAFHPGQPVAMHRVGDGFVGAETLGASGLTADGRITWHWSPPTRDDTGAFIVGDDVVVAEPDLRRGDHEVVALDARTGKELWTQPSNGYTTYDEERVFVTTCAGQVDDPVGDCTMTAYGARSGTALWTNAFGTYTENTSHVGDRLLVQAFRDGHSSSFLLLDPTTGATVTDDLDPDQKDYLAYPLGDDRLAVVGDDRDGSDGCRRSVTLFDLDGAQVWSRDVRAEPDERRLKFCDQLYPSDADGDVAVTGLATSTSVLDGRTGKLLWHTEQQGLSGPASQGVLIVEDESDLSTTGFDVRSGEVLWRNPVNTGIWRVNGRYLTGNTDCDPTCSAIVLDILTGEKVLQVPGVPEEFVEPSKPGGRLGLMTRVDNPNNYSARYGFVTLPRLP